MDEPTRGEYHLFRMGQGPGLTVLSGSRCAVDEAAASVDGAYERGYGLGESRRVAESYRSRT